MTSLTTELEAIEASSLPAMPSVAMRQLQGLRNLLPRIISTLKEQAGEVDCGQDGVCARAPGCNRHWSERAREIASDLQAAREELQRYKDAAAAQLAYDMASIVTDTPEERAARDLQAAREECERWSANYTELERDAGQLRAKIEQLKKERDEAVREAAWCIENETRAAKERDAARADADRMRTEIATPCDTEVTWHNNGRGPRVVFEVGSEDYVVTAERAKALGAALLRTAIEALAASADKEGK